jgi:tetratricopeptide (TPR) repeat protein
MKGKHCLFLLLILGALLACNDPKPVTDALHRAEALMDEHPDSAWAVLNTLSPDEMGQNRTRALYALLYTQAQDKTYRDETNDSLISIAVDYYRHTDDARRKYLSYYYKGRVYFNAKDYQNATLCYMEAEQLADEVGDDYLVGLLYSELGRIYDIYYDYPKSLEAYQKAAECYERAGKIRHRNCMWYNQSNVYRNLNRYDESERLLWVALNSAQKEGDNTLVKSCMGTLVMLYIEEKQMEKAQELYVTLESVAGTNYGSASFMGKIAQMYLSKKHFNQARQCLDKGWKRAENRIDSVGLYFSAAELMSVLGEEKEAYQELMKGVALQNKEAHQALQQPVLTAQRDYLSEKLEFEAYKLRMEKRFRLLYILLFSLVIVMVVYVLSRKLKKEKEKARKTIDELNCEILHRDRESRHKIASLLEELEEQDKSASASIQGLRSELQRQEEDYHRYIKEAEQLQHELQADLQEKSLRAVGMFRESISTMGEIMLDFEEIKAPNTQVENIIQQWKKKYFVGAKALGHLEKLVNEFHDDAMVHFRREVRLRSDADYQQVCCLFAGISVKVTAWLMNKNENTVYHWRQRLYDKIKSSDFEYKNLYLKLIDK